MPESSDSEIRRLEQTVRELQDTVHKLERRLPQSEKNGERKSNISPLLLTILGAIGTGILAISNSFFQGKQAHQLEQDKLSSSHQLEQDKLRSNLILKAIDYPDAEERKKALTFYVEAGLLSDPEGKIAGIEAENIPEAPQAEGQSMPTDIRKGRAFGIDATHDDVVDWKQLKEHGVVFAFVKATDGTSFKDSAFRKNWSAMKDAGIIRGAYHHLSAGNAEVQAKTFFDQVGLLMADDLPPAVDFENAVSGPNPTIQDLEIFIKETQKFFGRRPIIYGGSLLRDAVKRASGPSAFFACPLWIARFRDSPLPLPDGWTKWTFWQFSDGQVGPTDSIRQVFRGDMNLFNGSEADLRKFIAESKP